LFKIKFIVVFLFLLGRKNYAGNFKQNEFNTSLIITDLVYQNVFNGLFITGDRLPFTYTFDFLIPVSFSLVVSLIFPSFPSSFFLGKGGGGGRSAVGNLFESCGNYHFC
jgi:hypothetical protein